MHRKIIGLLVPFVLFAQLGFNGKLGTNRMIRLNGDGTIDLPYHLLTTDITYTVGSMDLKSGFDLESRWSARPAGTEKPAGLWKDKNDQLVLSLNQLYATWFPSFGEVSVGYLIHSWGAADANNPTDNISPYDYYYLFETGADRKAASLAGNVKAYLGDLTIDAIVLPEHAANRMPHAEPAFPFEIPAKPAEEAFADVEDPLELGLRLQYSIGFGDFSTSYFSGHDRGFNVLGWYFNLASGSPPQMTYGYRETQVLGLDAVVFPGNWTLRAEAARFHTTNPFSPPTQDTAWFIFTTDAVYTQYVVQAEYLFANEMQLMVQLLGTSFGSVDGFAPTLPTSTNPMPGVTGLTADNFQIGMGTPFALISDRALLISTMATLWDNSLELKGMLMLNLESLDNYDPFDKGLMLNLGGEYTLREGLNLTASVVQFAGGSENIFGVMEDFSNLTVGIQYSF